ncbi:MAG: putative diguanylate cyclase YcdT [Betaproteobacteria bacterium ADurb.Bin341]|nr:MAG: putative diguanylate cyclase YcdT [Betaproteobacteria bacterium ADurb.Bin341]
MNVPGTDPNPYRYSKRNFSLVFFLGGLAMLSFVPRNWRSGDVLVAVLIAVLVAVIWGLAAWALLRQRNGSAVILWVTVLCNVGCLVALFHLHRVGVYWFFPLLLATSFVLPWRWSIPVNVVNVAFALFFAFGWMPLEQYYRLIATLSISMLFSSLFSINIERQGGLLMSLVIHDPLTGAFNRRYFEQKLSESLRYRKREGMVSCLVLIDIDHLKPINDIHGHAMGDRVLVAFSSFISGQLRPLDRFFRLGGEEFAILLPDTTATQAVQLAERFRRYLADGSLDGILPAFTISAGVAESPEQGTEGEWLAQCDQALYAAKESGRNRVVVAENTSVNESPGIEAL